MTVMFGANVNFNASPVRKMRIAMKYNIIVLAGLALAVVSCSKKFVTLYPRQVEGIL